MIKNFQKSVSRIYDIRMFVANKYTVVVSSPAMNMMSFVKRF